MCLKSKEYNERLTVEELKRFKEFELISDLEAENIIESLFQLAIIGYNIKE